VIQRVPYSYSKVPFLTLEGTIKHVKDAKVVVLSAGLEAAKPDTKDTVLIKTPEELLNYNKGEERAIEQVW
jgi:T-complex protein 1 subunit theta